jgi:hypothetical protein
VSAEWLGQLAPEHAPAPPPWWPPAAGWWVAVPVAALVLTLLVRWWLDPRRPLRRAALRELAHVEHSDADDRDIARALENLLRRYAIAAFGRARVARLAGEAWLSFLGEVGGEALAGPLGRSLLAAAFSAGPAAPERERWLAATERFIRTVPRARRWPLRRGLRAARVNDLRRTRSA